MGCQRIMHKPCGWHNVVFISFAVWRGDRQNNPDSVGKVLWRVQASLMKMNKRWDLPLMAVALSHTYSWTGGTAPGNDPSHTEMRGAR